VVQTGWNITSLTDKQHKHDPRNHRGGWMLLLTAAHVIGSRDAARDKLWRRGESKCALAADRDDAIAQSRVPIKVCDGVAQCVLLLGAPPRDGFCSPRLKIRAASVSRIVQRYVAIALEERTKQAWARWTPRKPCDVLTSICHERVHWFAELAHVPHLDRTVGACASDAEQHVSNHSSKSQHERLSRRLQWRHGGQLLLPTTLRRG
jgi:hypothetical protein